MKTFKEIQTSLKRWFNRLTEEQKWLVGLGILFAIGFGIHYPFAFMMFLCILYILW